MEAIAIGVAVAVISAAIVGAVKCSGAVGGVLRSAASVDGPAWMFTKKAVAPAVIWLAMTIPAMLSLVSAVIAISLC